MSLKDHVPDSVVSALATLRPEDAEALYNPQTVVKMARELEVLRIIAGNIHPCACAVQDCLKCTAAGRDGSHLDPSLNCSCVCHQRIQDALIIWDPERLPDHPDVTEETVDE